MKKVFLLLVLAVATFTLFACSPSEYQVDGEFLAYEVGVHSNAPMVTTVTVTIEKGKVVGYYIDARQGKATQTEGADTEATDDDKWSFTWNEKTKKELGDDYGMVARGGAVAEWYVQAELIEDYMLENGVDSVETDGDTYITNITGVTMKDGGYTELAAAALELAKEGKFQAVSCSADDLTIASMIVDSKGNFTELFLDVLQGRPSGATFAWRDKTKQELGDDYGMSDGSNLEWYEQAKVITDYITDNGWTMNSTPDLTSAGVTITTSEYYETFDLLFGFAGDSVE